MVIFINEMSKAYIKETEDLLKQAVECIYRLEMEYSAIDINKLFRMAHIIRESSHKEGNEDIVNLMQNLEGMLIYARKGSIRFDKSIVSLCFEAMDIVKKILLCKSEEGSQEIMEGLANAASRINEMIEVFIRVNRSVE